MGYQNSQNRPGILLETHMLKPYRARVEATYAALAHTSEILYRERTNLLKLEAEADAFTASREFRAQPMALAFTAGPESELVPFKGFQYTCEKSDLTGGDWFTYDPAKPVTFQIPCFRTLKPGASARLPEAYVIPAQWTEVIQRLDAHGIPFRRLREPVKARVGATRFESWKWSPGPVEGRLRVEECAARDGVEEMDFPAGSVLVPMDHRRARLVAHLLEPASPDSLLRWGFFNAVFEQKEYGESYVTEALARRMLAEDPGLKARFEAWRASLPAGEASPDRVLNWFYQRSPYGDRRMGLYPVGRVLDGQALAALSAQCAGPSAGAAR
jgi:hypothetical protein